MFNIRNRVAFANDRNCGLVIKITKITYEDSNQQFAKNCGLSNRCMTRPPMAAANDIMTSASRIGATGSS